MDGQAHIVDSSVLIAFYIEDDSCHKEAFALLQEIERGTLLLHPYVIQEVVTVLVYKSGVALAKKFIADIQKAHNVTVLPVDVTREMKRFVSLNKRVSFADSSLIAAAEGYRFPLVTFDKQLRSLVG